MCMQAIEFTGKLQSGSASALPMQSFSTPLIGLRPSLDARVRHGCAGGCPRFAQCKAAQAARSVDASSPATV
jgi:hypothetical protein